MSNINRRDYLKGMAATAGAIATSRLEVFGQRSPGKARHRRSTRPRKEITSISKLNWLTTPDRPSLDAFVTALFTGLMGYSYDSGYDIGKVGFHGHSGHKLVVQIYNYPGCTLDQEVNVNGAKKITLKVLPQSSRHVDYFEQNANQTFDRLNGHDNDFRWLPDLDSDDFYSKGYDKHSDHFGSWLHVSNATFYTRLRSRSTFDLVDSSENIIKHYGLVARVMAAAIDLPAGGAQYVALQVDDRPAIELRPAGNRKYQIVFKNECYSCPEPDICSNDETKRNDFHFARKVLDLPILKKKIGLKIHEKRAAVADATICGLAELFQRSTDSCQVHRNTDEAPCMGGGYGADRL